MQTLLSSTSAYKLLQSERNENRLNHAYLILLDDARSLRLALNVFARVFFGCEEENQGGRYARIAELIQKESFSDCLFFPKKDKKDQDVLATSQPFCLLCAPHPVVRRVTVFLF